MTEEEIKSYIKRLETVQNMTDVTGVKEVCEILMDLLEEMKTKSKTFGFTQEDKK
jgi:hypothetical protein